MDEGASATPTTASVDAAGTATGVSDLSPVPGWRVRLIGVVEEEEAMSAVKSQKKFFSFTVEEEEEEREIGGGLLKLSWFSPFLLTIQGFYISCNKWLGAGGWDSNHETLKILKVRDT